MNKPLVSIVCLTFNHSEFISQCLESLLCQDADFPVEILVHDDASTDDTLQIIESYRIRHPSTIKIIAQNENQFSKGLGFVGIQLCVEIANGKYIAYCEGDDFWCDPKKLHKQVSFLDKNPSYSSCAHDTRILSNTSLNGSLYSDFVHNIFLKKKKNTYTIKDTLTGNLFHISSIMFRNIELKYPIWINRFSAFDMVFFMLLAEKGDIHFMNDVMSVYRNNSKGITSTRKEYSTKILFLEMSLHIVRLMNRYFRRVYQNNVYEIVSVYYMEIAFLYLKKSNRSLKKSIKMMNISQKYNLSACIKHFIISLYRLFKSHVI